MSNRCARCDDLNPRRTLNPDGDWVDYLVDERDAGAPVGTLIVPLCTDCYADARDVEDHEAFLDDLNTDALVDEVSG
jgi:hypothetical protein